MGTNAHSGWREGGGVGLGERTEGAGTIWHCPDGHHAAPSSVNAVLDKGRWAHPGTLTPHPCGIPLPPIPPSPPLRGGQRAPPTAQVRTGHDFPKVSQLSARVGMHTRPVRGSRSIDRGARLPTGPVARTRPAAAPELMAATVLRWFPATLSSSHPTTPSFVLHPNPVKCVR